jgi:hypothetical protein
MQVPHAHIEQPRDAFAVGDRGRTAIGKSSARAIAAMSAMVSIEAAACSMSTRAKSTPAAFSSIRMDGLRDMVIQVPICTSPRSTPARIRLPRIRGSPPLMAPRFCTMSTRHATSPSAASRMPRGGDDPVRLHP